jgi:hypothetical protein
MSVPLRTFAVLHDQLEAGADVAAAMSVLLDAAAAERPHQDWRLALTRREGSDVFDAMARGTHGATVTPVWFFNDPTRLLRKLEAHRACRPALLTYAPMTEEALATLPLRDRRRRVRAQIEAIQATPDYARALHIMRALGAARHAPAVELLARLWRHSLISPVRQVAGQALLEIGTPEAHEALQAALEDADTFPNPPLFAIRSILATQPFKAFDRLAPFFNRRHHALVATALRLLGPTGGPPYTHWGMPVVPQLLRADRRWVRMAIGMRRDPEFGSAARWTLRSLTTEEVEAALREVPDPPQPPVVPYGGPRDLAARYARGEHEAVWNWLRHPGVMKNAELWAEAQSVAILTMERVRRNVERVNQRLASGRYPFDDSTPSFAPPKASVADDIGRIEKDSGGPVPLSLRAFWTVVGQVDWTFEERDDVSYEWRNLPLRDADPLCLDSPSDAWDRVPRSRVHGPEVLHPEVAEPQVLYVALDYLHKARMGGDCVGYGFAVPNDAVDPVFENEAHGLPFVDYLRLCFRWGGFPRLESDALSTEGSRTLLALTDGLEPF